MAGKAGLGVPCAPGGSRCGFLGGGAPGSPRIRLRGRWREPSAWGRVLRVGVLGTHIGSESERGAGGVRGEACEPQHPAGGPQASCPGEGG